MVFYALHDPNNINTKRIQHIIDAILIDSSLNPLSNIATNMNTKRINPTIRQYLIIFLYHIQNYCLYEYFKIILSNIAFGRFSVLYD